MTYCFRKRESLSEGLRRTADEQIARAIEELSAAHADRQAALHEARKRFKRIRAVLRLAKTSLGSVAEEENAVFRELGRTFSEARDAEAMLETLDGLESVGGGQLSRKTLLPLRSALTEQRDRLGGSNKWFRVTLAEVLPQLEAAHGRAAAWPLEGDGFDLIRDGLRRGYRSGKQAMVQAGATGADGDFHEWRKRAKDHWYHAILLRRCWPDHFRGYCKTLNRLSDHLGDHHNLVVLRHALESGALAPEALSGPLLAAIAHEQARLAGEARHLGLLVYTEKPAAFVERVENYWRTWRA